MPKDDPAKIELLVLDVDGVLTDGRIIYDDAGGESKSFNVRDGAGIKYWHRGQTQRTSDRPAKPHRRSARR